MIGLDYADDALNRGHLRCSGILKLGSKGQSGGRVSSSFVCPRSPFVPILPLPLPLAVSPFIFTISSLHEKRNGGGGGRRGGRLCMRWKSSSSSSSQHPAPSSELPTLLQPRNGISKIFSTLLRRPHSLLKPDRAAFGRKKTKEEGENLSWRSV